jgi:hypothetical protein
MLRSFSGNVAFTKLWNENENVPLFSLIIRPVFKSYSFKSRWYFRISWQTFRCFIQSLQVKNRTGQEPSISDAYRLWLSSQHVRCYRRNTAKTISLRSLRLIKSFARLHDADKAQSWKYAFMIFFWKSKKLSIVREKLRPMESSSHLTHSSDALNFLLHVKLIIVCLPVNFITKYI